MTSEPRADSRAHTGLGPAGLRRHDLRHTGATWMADAGVSLHVLREILGPRSLETTRGYLHADTGI